MQFDGCEPWEHGSISFSLTARGRNKELDDGRSMIHEAWQQFCTTIEELPEALAHRNVTKLTPGGVSTPTVLHTHHADYDGIHVALKVSVSARQECDKSATLTELLAILHHMDGVIRHLQTEKKKKAQEES